MPKFTVELGRVMNPDFGTVEVEADDQLHAEDLAKTMARRGDPAVKWTDGDEPQEVYVNQVSAEPEVRKFLTVSASHLPQDFVDRLHDQATNGRGLAFDREVSFWPFAGEYGFFLYAPDAPDDEVDELEYPPSVQRLLLYARRECGCSFVLFDQDGEVLEGFETYEEP